jgi:intraflagellar transport protein 122
MTTVCTQALPTSYTRLTVILLDAEELQPLCMRCSTHNPVVSKTPDECTACKHPFVYSFHSLEPLPLVEFVLEEGLSEEEASELMAVEPSSGSGGDGSTESHNAGGDVFTLDENDDGDGNDAFVQALLSYEVPEGPYEPIPATRDMLRESDRSVIFTVRWADSDLPPKYYRNMIPETPIVLCDHCKHFFHGEDYEFAVLQESACPFCASTIERPTGLT